MERSGSSPLEERRCRMSFTQTELGLQTNVDQSLISMIESGRNPLTYESAKKLSTFLDIDPFQLVLENVLWTATNHNATFEACEDFGEVVSNQLLRLPKSKQLAGLKLACNIGQARLIIGETLTNQILVEHMRRPPSVLLSPEQVKQQQTLTPHGQRLQAQQQNEAANPTYARAPNVLLNDRRKLDLPNKQEPIDKQLADRAGVIIEDSKLRTAKESQQQVEQVQAPPAILLKQKGGKK